ncbi:MAG: inorganic diphosphatase [Candidatus Woesearchaeota archaeon]
MAIENPWHDVEIGEQAPYICNAIVEIPKHSTKKYELDKETGLLKLDRFMYSAVHYPADYGFIPKTLWYDDDPLDVFILTHSPVVPLCLCKIKILGVIRMVDDSEADDKIIAVHTADPRYRDFNTLDSLPKHYMAELRNFLETYKMLEKKEVKIFEVLGKDEACKSIQEAQRMYREKFNSE